MIKCTGVRVNELRVLFAKGLSKGDQVMIRAFLFPTLKLWKVIQNHPKKVGFNFHQNRYRARPYKLRQVPCAKSKVRSWQIRLTFPGTSL